MAIEFKRDGRTGRVVAYRDRKRVGEITDMGDEIIKETSKKGKDDGKGYKTK